ncbi:hypothetical protein CsatB_007064 [Cannabis sativa]
MSFCSGAKFRFQKFVWNRIAVPKHRFICWQVMNNRLLTRDHLPQILQIDSSLCSICCNSNENLAHLFFSCNFSQQVLKHINGWIGFNWPVMIENWRSWAEKLNKDVKNMIAATIFSATMYYIWHSRNTCVFNRYTYSVKNIVDMIKKDFKYRLSNFVFKKLKGEERNLLMKIDSL